MTETANHKLKKQLKQASTAIDLIKISQRSQHTSIKEALRKILRCISMMTEIEDETDLGQKEANEDPIKINKEIKERTDKEIKNNETIKKRT